MAFDPDAYLAQADQPAPSGFDPDAYLASTELTNEQDAAANNDAARLEGTDMGDRVVRDDGTTIPLGDASQTKPKLSLPTRSEHPAKAYTQPSNWQVAGNALMKGAASTADMYQAGHPANFVRMAGEAIKGEPVKIMPTAAQDLSQQAGLINPEFEPQNTEQRIIDAGGQALAGGMLTGGTGGIKSAVASGLGGLASGVASQSATEMGAPAAVSIPIGMVAGAGTSALSNRISGATVNSALKQQNAQLDEAFKNARNEGFVIPASQSNPNSLVANVADIVAGGRPKMQQSASLKNQAKVNEIVRNELDLPKDTPISLDSLKAIREDAAVKGYEPVKAAGVIVARPNYNDALDKLTEQTRKAKQGFAGYDDAGLTKTIESLRTKEFDADSGVSMSRQLREDASKAYAQGDKTLGKALKGASAAIEDEIEAHLVAQGNSRGLKDFREARQVMAKTFSIEKALNDTTGNVSATKLGKQLDKGAPLSGGLKKIARAGKLPGASLSDVKYATPGASQLEGWGSLGTALATGNPLMLGLPVARGALRETLLTRPVSKALGTPSYKQFGLTQQNKNALLSVGGMQAERGRE